MLSQSSCLGRPGAATIWLILLIAMVVRLSAAVYWHHLSSADEHYFRLADSHSYWTLAEQIARGEPYQYGNPDAQVFRTPLYPLLLAPLTWIPNLYWAVLAARCLGAMLGTIAVLLLIRLAQRLNGLKAGIVAGVIGALYPSAIGMSVVVLSEMLFLPLMIGQILLWSMAGTSESQNGRELAEFSLNRKYRRYLALASGIVGGLACLTRPSWLLFTPLLTVVHIMLGKKDSGRYSAAALALLGLITAMAPWWVRNALITDKLVLTTLQVGPSLLDGLRPGATGASDSNMGFMDEITRKQREADAQSSKPLESTFEWRVNRRATRTALAWAKENPSAVCVLAYKKLKRIWSLWPDGKELASDTMRLAITFSCFPVTLLALFYSIRYWSERYCTLAILWLPCLYFTALHLVFVGSVRYREPGVFLLIVIAGLGSTQRSHSLLNFFRQFQRGKVPQTPRLERQWQDEPFSELSQRHATGGG